MLYSGEKNRYSNSCVVRCWVLKTTVVQKQKTNRHCHNKKQRKEI